MLHQGLFLRYSFNTQPPEGGWRKKCPRQQRQSVSTHSRPKAAGFGTRQRQNFISFQHTAARRRLGLYYFASFWKNMVSTHSRPKAAGSIYLSTHIRQGVSTHSRPKAAGCLSDGVLTEILVSTHSRPKAAGSQEFLSRRNVAVSTHSRPKAAGNLYLINFNER